MMNGGDLYELAKILDHSNIKMTERLPSWRGAYRQNKQHGASDVEPT